MSEKINSQKEAKYFSDLPTFPSNFIFFPENCFFENDSLIIPEAYQEIISELINLGSDSKKELYNLVLINTDSKKRYISNLRTGKETRLDPSYYLSKDDDSIGSMMISEVIHTHTVGEKFYKKVYSIISNTDLWTMRNYQMDRVWVLAPFSNTILVVEAIKPRANTSVWVEAYFKFEKLFNNKNVTYQELLTSLVNLSVDLGINIFSGEIGDTKLKKIN